MASKSELKQMAARVLLGFSTLAVACGATALEVGPDHPAAPGYPSSPVPESGVLKPNFDPNPVSKPSASSSAPTAPSSAVVYQCPMHAEIKRPAPGRCPICGMNLEPVSPGHAEEHPAP